MTDQDDEQDEQDENEHNTNNRHLTGNKKLTLPKFHLDPPEWKEVQRLRRAGLTEQADAVEAHFKSGEDLPYVTHGRRRGVEFVTISDEYVLMDDLKDHPEGHLARWMVDNMLARLA